MSLRNKIQSSVDKAFRAVGDLAENVTLRTKVSEGYDFATGEVSDKFEEATVQAIVTYVKQKPDASEVLAPRKEVLIKEVDLKEPNLYDEVLISEKVHTIISFSKEPGLVTLLVTGG
jgi:hypothetical protein